MDTSIWRNLTDPCKAINLKTVLSAAEQTFDITEDFHPFECEAYEFDGSENVISEWGLVCDRKYLVSVVEMCFLAGAAIGSICSGWVSDRYGRRHTLMILILMQAIFGKLMVDMKFVSFACIMGILTYNRLIIHSYEKLMSRLDLVG